MSRALVRALRARGVDVLAAREAGLIQTPDQEHIEYATSLDRVILTFNVRDYTRLHYEYLSTGRHHSGIIVSDQLQVGTLVRRLLKLMASKSATSMRN